MGYLKTIWVDESIPAIDAANLNKIEDGIDKAAPTGSLKMWPTNTPPTGWIKRNGAAISRTTYADLFAVIGTDYGVGDNSTTFNVPDDRGYFERGWDDARGVDTGRTFGSYQADGLKTHGHTASCGNDSPDHSHSLTGYYGSSGSALPAYNAGETNGTNNSTSGASARHSHAITVNDYSGTSENIVKNRAYLPIIKY